MVCLSFLLFYLWLVFILFWVTVEIERERDRKRKETELPAESLLADRTYTHTLCRYPLRLV
jgi:hypothetical protein